MLKKVLQTNRSAARIAVAHVRATPVAATPVATVPVVCMMPYARHAEGPARFLSSHATTVPYIAATVSRNK